MKKRLQQYKSDYLRRELGIWRIKIIEDKASKSEQKMMRKCEKASEERNEKRKVEMPEASP